MTSSCPECGGTEFKIHEAPSNETRWRAFLLGDDTGGEEDCIICTGCGWSDID